MTARPASSIDIPQRQRRAVLLTAAALIAAGVAGAPAASAQTASSNRPIRFVVPFSAGSATDNVARIVAQAMGDELKAPITVENKPGANGILGAEQVKAAAPDGHTLLVTTSTTQAANASLYRKLSYDPVKDFVPIGKLGVTGFILMVRPEFPASNVREFVAHAKANPGKLAYGQGSSGSHVSAALFTQMTGIDAQMVPYKSIPPAVTDLIGGQLQFAFVDVGNAVSQMQGGKLKPLGVTLSRRAGRAPNVPTIAEQGVPGYELVAWFGLMAPAGTPPEVAARLTRALLAVMAKPDVRERVAAAGIDPDPSDGAALAKLIDSEIGKWAKYVKDANITPE